MEEEEDGEDGEGLYDDEAPKEYHMNLSDLLK